MTAPCLWKGSSGEVKTLLKDTFREIKRTFGRFLAIFFIVALGTAFFVGIKTTCPDMKASADEYYKATNFMDFELLSNVGFDGADVAAIKKQKDVKDVMPSYSVDAVATFGGKEKVLSISSLAAPGEKGVNNPQLLSGRLPDKSGECAIEYNKLAGVLPKLGDVVSLSSGNGEKLSDKLKAVRYRVVGIVESPLYISKDRGTTDIGSGQVSAFMEIPESDFRLSYYTGLYLTVGLDSAATAYSTSYDDETSPVEKSLSSFADKRASARQSELKSDATAAYDKGLASYNSSKKSSDAAVAAAQKKLDDSEKSIESGENQLAAGRRQLDAAVSAAQQKLAGGQKALDAGTADYNSKLAAFQKQKSLAEAAGIYGAQKPAFDAEEEQLDAAKKQLDAEASELEANRLALGDEQSRGEAQLKTETEKLDGARAALAAGQKELTSQKAGAEKKLESAKNKLDGAKAQIAAIPSVKWYVLGRDTVSGYVDYQSAADRMNAIARVFPVIFILVAILVCLTTMSRMVEEQRTFMGTAKALGYKSSAIAVKFLLYALLASVTGGILGLFVGFTFFPTVIDNAYAILYTLPRFTLLFDVPFAAAALVVGILVTSLSAISVCYSELSLNAATLMRPRAPRAGKTIILERVRFLWKRLKFTQKVTARNIFRYKSRFFMTVVGVGGCTALLLVGFGLSDAITAIGSRQFGAIDVYSLNADLKDNISSSDMKDIESALSLRPEYNSLQWLFEKSIDVTNGSKSKTCELMVPDNAAKLSDFIELRVRTTGQPVPLTGDGVVLTEKMAGELGVRPGDSVNIKNGSGYLKAKVTGVCENYLQHYLFMSPTLYRSLYKAAPAYNELDVKLKTDDTEAQQRVSRALVSQKGISAVYLMSDNVRRFNDTIKSIYSIVYVLIVSAALLSFVVLFTLTNININERLREIATIKVLGFYDKEVSAYIFRENIILTVVGTAAGLLMGVPLAHYVILTAEVDMLMFGRQIYPQSYAYAAVLTLLFAWLVNLVMIRRLRGINMVEALKTVE